MYAKEEVAYQSRQLFGSEPGVPNVNGPTEPDVQTEMSELHPSPEAGGGIQVTESPVKVALLVQLY
jgi:hypothetical protein